MNIDIETFKQLELRIGTIISAEKVENADKLLKLEVDFGEFKRQIVSGIALWYTPEELVGKQCPFILNLEPRKFKGVESQGMLLAGNDEKAILLHPNQEVPPGTPIV